MERIEECPSPPPFGGLNRAWIEARVKESEMVRREKRIRIAATALMIAVGILATYAVVVTVAVVSTRADWVDFGLCPTDSSGDSQDRVVRSATPVAMALQVKVQECMSVNGSYIKGDDDCVPICRMLPKMPECLHQAEVGQPTTATTPTPTEAPATTMGGEEEKESLGGDGRNGRTDQTTTPYDQDGYEAALGRLDIRLAREKRAAYATARRICLCSLEGRPLPPERRGCRCVDSDEEWPIDILMIRYGKDVDIRVQDQSIWSMTF